MYTRRSHYQQDRRFSAALQSWFPAIHQKTFPGTSGTEILQSAVRRTMVRA